MNQSESPKTLSRPPKLCLIPVTHKDIPLYKGTEHSHGFSTPPLSTSWQDWAQQFLEKLQGPDSMECESISSLPSKVKERLKVNKEYSKNYL